MRIQIFILGFKGLMGSSSLNYNVLFSAIEILIRGKLSLKRLGVKCLKNRLLKRKRAFFNVNKLIKFNLPSVEASWLVAYIFSGIFSNVLSSLILK